MKKVKEFITQNIEWIALVLCVASFLLLAISVFSKEFIKTDILGYAFISTHIISDKITPITKSITNFGGAICLCTLSILSLLLKNKKISLAIILNLAVATLLNTALKNILQRSRPIEHRIINVSGYSFPSGHSMVSMAFYGFLIHITCKYIKNKYLKVFITTFLSVLILAIGTSRIYLGVHYTTDVAAGFVLAISYLIIYTKLINKFVLAKN